MQQASKKDARGDSHHTDTVPKIPGIKEQGLESLPDKEGYREGADNAQQHIAQDHSGEFSCQAAGQLLLPLSQRQKHSEFPAFVFKKQTRSVYREYGTAGYRHAEHQPA